MNVIDSKNGSGSVQGSLNVNKNESYIVCCISKNEYGAGFNCSLTNNNGLVKTLVYYVGGYTASGYGYALYLVTINESDILKVSSYNGTGDGQAVGYSILKLNI